MAEDLFATGRIRGVILNGGALRETRRVRDVEAWLDDLARLEANQDGAQVTSLSAVALAKAESRGNEAAVSAAPSHFTRNVITFSPEGTRGVTAYVDGRKTASA